MVWLLVYFSVLFGMSACSSYFAVVCSCGCLFVDSKGGFV
jgi:hypothetical protein